eukprot:3821922-Ditylum_brightwellii.AAC.2
MRHPAEAIRTISGNHQSTSTSIIGVRHLVGLCCLDLTSKCILVVYLPQLEVDINGEGNLCDEWITGTTSDAAGKIQPVKVFANLVFHNFNKLACPYAEFPKSMKGETIMKIPTDNAVIPPTRRQPAARGQSPFGNPAVKRTQVVVRQSNQ